jgi:hypothetical protein
MTLTTRPSRRANEEPLEAKPQADLHAALLHMINRASRPLRPSACSTKVFARTTGRSLSLRE